MRLEIFIFGITAFLIYNAYNDGKFLKLFWSFKKYYKMIFYASLGIGIYYMLKRNPRNSREMLLCANNYVKYLPIDKNSMDVLSPILDFTNAVDTDVNGFKSTTFMESFNGLNNGVGGGYRTTGYGNRPVKRSVSETKKKYVASNQDWKCASCRQKLDHTFEIDHRIRLEYGGSNDVDNLVALCRNCHGKKTASENM